MVDFTGGTWRSLIDGSEVVAIPDEGLNHSYIIDDETATNVIDVQGDKNLDIIGADLVSDSDAFGGVALELNRDDPGYASTDSPVSADIIGDDEDYSVCSTIKVLDTSALTADRNIWVANTPADYDGDALFGLSVTESFEIFGQHFSDGTRFNSVYEATQSELDNNWLSVIWTCSNATDRNIYVELQEGSDNTGFDANGSADSFWTFGGEPRSESDKTNDRILPARLGRVDVYDRILDETERQSWHNAQPHTS